MKTPKRLRRKYQHQSKQSFDNQAFVEDVYEGQQAFVRKDDNPEKIKELITYTIRRIKQVLSVPKE